MQICKSFSSLQGKCNHRKICKQNPSNIPSSIQPTIITNKFGNEDLSYIEDRKEVDERYAPALACFSDTMDLTFFNSDHPENQTVRKSNKKSDLIELRVNQDDYRIQSGDTENQNKVRIVVKCSDRFQRHASLENAKRTEIGRTYT